MDFKPIIEYFTKLEREIADLKYEISELKDELELVKKAKQAPKQKLLSTKEAAEFLNLTTQTVRNYVCSGKLGCLKGEKMRALKFKQEHLDDFVINQLHYMKSKSQIRSEIVTMRYTKPKCLSGQKRSKWFSLFVRICYPRKVIAWLLLPYIPTIIQNSNTI